MASVRDLTVVSASEQAHLAKFVRRHWCTALVVVGGCIVLKVGLVWLGSRLGAELHLAWRWWGLALVLLVVGRFVARVRWWVRGYRRKLAAAGLVAPNMGGLLDARTLEMKNRKAVLGQWPAVCTQHKLLGFGKIVPDLFKLTADVRGDLEALIAPGPLKVVGGVGAFQAVQRDIAEMLGCREVRVKRTGAEGHATITFRWTEQMDRVLPIQELPAGPYGRVAYAIAGDSTMSVRMALSLLIIGQTGSGKSKLLRALVVDLIRRQVPTWLYVLDPKRQELVKFSRRVGATIGSMTVKGYAAGIEDCGRLILQLQDIVHQRQEELGAADIDEWEEKHADRWPLIMVPIDEVFELFTQSKPIVLSGAGRTAKTVDPLDVLLTILSVGRAAGVWPVLLSQVAHKEILGLNRSLVRQRLVLMMDTPQETGMAFGDTDAEKRGATCSDIHEPGIGFAWSDDERGYTRFRGALCGQDDWNRLIGDGELPPGMEYGQVMKVDDRECGVYKFWDVAGRCLYVGKGFDPVKNRWPDHAGKLGKPMKPWWPLVDHSQTRPIQWRPTEAAALQFEQEEIHRLTPIGNEHHNKANPWRGRPVEYDPELDGVFTAPRRRLPRPQVPQRFRRTPAAPVVDEWPVLEPDGGSMLETFGQPDPAPVEVVLAREVQPQLVISTDEPDIPHPELVTSTTFDVQDDVTVPVQVPVSAVGVEPARPYVPGRRARKYAAAREARAARVLEPAGGGHQDHWGHE